MKTTFLAIVLSIGILTFPALVGAKTVYVKSYYKPSTGTFVSPSYRTSPNKTKIDNYSTKGNYNPYSGKSGTQNPYNW